LLLIMKQFVTALLLLRKQHAALLSTYMASIIQTPGLSAAELLLLTGGVNGGQSINT
jgi:hypothetical protein